MGVGSVGLVFAVDERDGAFDLRPQPTPVHKYRRSRRATSLDEDDPPLLARRAVGRVHRIVETIGLDEPWPVFLVDVEHEDEIFVLQIAGNRRMMTAAGAEERTSREVDDITARWVIGGVQVLAEGREIQVAQNGDLSSEPGPRQVGELVERDATRQHAEERRYARSVEHGGLVTVEPKRVHHVDDARGSTEASVLLEIESGLGERGDRQGPCLGEERRVAVLGGRLDGGDARVVDAVAPEQGRNDRRAAPQQEDNQSDGEQNLAQSRFQHWPLAGYWTVP